MIYNTIFSASVIIFILAIVRHVLAMNAFLVQLRTQHETLFQQLGSPKWSIQVGDNVLRETIKWIKRREFESLNDPELERCYKAMKRANALAVLAGVAAVGGALLPAIIY